MENEEVHWEEVYRRLIEEAPYIPGVDISKIDGTDIPWANPKLIEQGQQFVAKNPLSTSLAGSAALLLGFSIKNLSTVLLRTGNFTGTVNCMERYVDTEAHVLNWYQFDTFHQYGEGFKSLQVVRKLHALALKKCLTTYKEYVPDETNIDRVEEKLKFIRAMKKDLALVDTSGAPNHLNTYNPKLLMNQYDFAMTQYGFFALIYMYPAAFGVYDTTELDAFVHMWAVFGRLIGIHDRYNLALYPSRELYSKIHDKIGVPSFCDNDLTTASLQFSLADALHRMMHLNLSAPALFYYSFNSKTSIPQFKGENLYKLLSWKEVIIVKLLALFILLMSKVWFINYIVRWSHPRFALANRDKILAEKKRRQKFETRQTIMSKEKSQRA